MGKEQIPVILGSEDDIDSFSRSVKATNAENTVVAYVEAARRFEQFLAEKKEFRGRTRTDMFGALRQGHLQEFVTWLVGLGLKASSVNTIVSGAMAYVRHLREQGYRITENLVNPKKPRVNDRIPSVLRVEDTLVTYMEVAATIPEPHRTAMLLLPLTGLRVGEMVQLRIRDVQAKPPWGYVLIVREGLGATVKGKADRMVPVLRQGNPILTNYLVKIRKNLPVFSTRPAGENWLFPTMTGDGEIVHIGVKSIQEKMRNIRGKVGLMELTPHTLRHTYASILEQAGIHGLRIAKLLGHKNLNTTNRYTHPSVDQMMGDLQKIDIHIQQEEEE